jgi:organic hydroperoxide reductase OsmC/OhrA
MPPAVWHLRHRSLLSVDAEVDLGITDGGYLLRARLNVSLPDLEREIAQAVVDAAHQICPYSKATRGNIDVTIQSGLRTLSISQQTGTDKPRRSR